MSVSEISTSATQPIKDPGHIQKVAREFESLFTSMMLRAMRKTVGQDSLIPTGMGERIYTEMLDDKYAEMLSNSGSLGLAELILKQVGEKGATDLPANPGSFHSWMLDKGILSNQTPYGSPHSQNRNKANLLSKAAKWEPLIDEASSKYNVDKHLIQAVIAQESAGNPYAVSRAGAKGLMQLMDTTAQDLGVSKPFDPRANIFGGVKYLRAMLDKFRGDEKLALASYNAGPGAVQRHGGIPPYQETRDYVQSVLDMRETAAADAAGRGK